MSILLLLIPLAAPAETRLEALQRKERESGGYSYFTFARRTLAQRLGVALPDVAPKAATPADPFGLISGASAIDESLSLKRVERPAWRGERAVPLTSVTGVTIGEHPWERMIGANKPRPEPLADLVPNDHWYLTCTSVAKLAEMSDLIDAWGGSALRMVQVQDRDYRLRRRYEAQLGVTLEAAKKVPPKLVRSLALTGSDLFFADGTDVSVIVDTPDPAALIEALGSPPGARKLPGHVILSNSPAALERILRTVAGKRPSLGASLDFKYMRTVFERDEKSEDAFVFLSDPFVRALVGPATRTKMARRAEARAALTRASHAALFHAAEHGTAKIAGLEEADLEVPDGKPVRWDAERGEAVSDVYGTLRAGTPLLELPTTDLTSGEKAAYEEFRRYYDTLWRQFFDPVGVRFKLTPGEVKAEAYILPLVQSAAYNSLRRFTDGRDMTHDAAKLGPAVGAQFRLFQHWGGVDPIAIQIDDSPALGRWLEGLVTGKASGDLPPTVVSMGGKNGEKLAYLAAGFLPSLLGIEKDVADYDKATTREFEGVKIKQVPINPEGFVAFHKKLREDVPDSAGPIKASLLAFFGPKPPPAFYSAWIAGNYHSAFDEKALERRITAWKKGATTEEARPVAAALMLSRKSPHLAAFLERHLEEQTRAKSHAAVTLWQELYDAKLVTAAMADAERDRVALRLFGFVPAVPDGSRFVARGGKVSNERHGSWAKPAAHESPDAASPLGKLVRSIQSVSADLRFREDGIHTTVKFTRK